MKRKTLFCMLLALLGLSLSCNQAEATWYWIHGSSGHVESGAAEVHQATGLVVHPPEGTAWVHFQVPTVGEASQGARYVRIKFNLVNALNSAIQQVKVYNGSTLVKTFDVFWGTAGIQTKTLDLGSVRSFM